jgi:hypothetical protein
MTGVGATSPLAAVGENAGFPPQPTFAAPPEANVLNSLNRPMILSLRRLREH